MSFWMMTFLCQLYCLVLCRYPVNEVIAELTQCVDHILVFFDPIQKAMIPRTLEVLRTIETLDRRTAPRVDFVLTKIDTINSSGDLLDVTGNVQGQLATALNIAHGQRTWRICLPDKGTVAPDMQKANELKQLMECFVDQIHGKVEKNLVILKRDVVELRDQTQARTRQLLDLTITLKVLLRVMSDGCVFLVGSSACSSSKC